MQILYKLDPLFNSCLRCLNRVKMNVCGDLLDLLEDVEEVNDLYDVHSERKIKNYKI